MLKYFHKCPPRIVLPRRFSQEALLRDPCRSAAPLCLVGSFVFRRLSQLGVGQKVSGAGNILENSVGTRQNMADPSAE